MSRHPIEPLSPEERELASRLSRLGHAEPSAALDAAILAAARAAVPPVATSTARVQPRRDRRWLGWSGVPGGLITGVGMAAALVVTVGVVWQLRPQPSLLPALGELPPEDSVVMDTEMVQRQRPPNPPPLPVAESAPAAPAVAARPARPANAQARQSAPQAAAPTAGVDFHDEPLPLPAYQARAGAVAEQRARGERDAAQAGASARVESQMAASPPPPAPTVASDAAASASSAALPARKSVATAEESTTLDRVEITGSNVLASLPIRSDAQLPPVEWLERVRARHQQGDLVGARASLTLFVRTHPRLRVPDDLRVLLRAQP